MKQLADLARTIASELDSSIEVLGVTGGKGGTGYVEILLRVHDCDVEPCRLSIGANRALNRPELEMALRDSMREHVRQRQQNRPH